MVSSAQSIFASRAAVCAVLLGSVFPFAMYAQAPDPAAADVHEPSSIADPLPEDRGAAALEQALRRLHTTASVMEIVAHPDDEDGSLLTYLSRGMGARVTLFTMTRGEGGQNAMSGDTYDALGVMRTNELLKADQYYGVKQLWGTQADFGFSKTQEEAFARWGHDRVLYDAVLAVRRERPQVILATFVGAVSDGHGQHQVSGEIAQEVFKAAGDAKVFPEQLKNGLKPWQPLAVYSMVPFAPISNGKVFDYATGKSAPAEFKNYVTGEVVRGNLSPDATMPVGTRDAALGRSYVQIARQGWGEQKSQNGGANPTLSGPASTSYHLWAVTAAARAAGGDPKPGDQQPGDQQPGGLFHNAKVNLDTGLGALTTLGQNSLSAEQASKLRKVEMEIAVLPMECPAPDRMGLAHRIAAAYRDLLDLQSALRQGAKTAQANYGLLFELNAKARDLESALQNLLGLEMVAFTTNSEAVQGGGPRGSSLDEMPASVAPGEGFRVRVHVTSASQDARLTRVVLASAAGGAWKWGRAGAAPDSPPTVGDTVFKVRAAENASVTAPYFTRQSIEQTYYDMSDSALRGRSFAPWPLSAIAEFTFDGVSIEISEAVQTMQRATGAGGYFQPLVVTPAVGVSMTPEAHIVPLDGSALPVTVTVHTQGAAEGAVRLKLPAGWHAEPAEVHFKRERAGDTEPIRFAVQPGANAAAVQTIEAVAESGGKTYESGWRSVGYQGLRPYNVYRAAELRTRRVDVKVAPGLRVGYVMGPGDPVRDAMEEMGVEAHLLTSAELLSGDLSSWDVIVIGIRAYSTRPELTTVQPRLDAFVRDGGTLIVQYQSATFPAPMPVSLGRIPERVVDETAPVRFLQADAPILNWPNRIGEADFAGWVEERGHSFASSWDAGYSAPTETADPGQDPQRGGLLVCHPGKGAYVYLAYALYRQLPELVPGAYRLLANLLSAGKAPQK